MDRFTVSTLINLSYHFGKMKGYLGKDEFAEEMTSIGVILMEIAVHHVSFAYFETKEKKEAWAQIEQLLTKL